MSDLPHELLREARAVLTAERLRHLLEYDPITGVFTNRVRRKARQAGAVIGVAGGSGYITLSLDGRLYYAHRLAWLYMTGRWPAAEIDHIDCNSLNNTFSNLREADSAQNKANTRRRSDNKSGYKGVCWNRARSKWMAQIRREGRPHFLGHFETVEEAAAAYAAAAQETFGEFARVHTQPDGVSDHG